MKYLKAFGAFILAAVFLLLAANAWYSDLIEPHRWDHPIIQKANEAGLEMVHRHTISSLIFPWTWFYPYATQVAFVRPQSIKETRGYIAAEVISFSRDDRGRIDSSSGMWIIDCRDNHFTILPDNTGDRALVFLADGSRNQKWWFPMGEQNSNYFCRTTTK